jgi:PIN domain nuclease of toxin-antitoxin system
LGSPSLIANGAASDVPLLLDTHAWVQWITEPSSLTPPTVSLIGAALADNRMWLSTVSTWEIALLVARGRLGLGIPVRDWVARTESLDGLRFMTLNNGLALRAVELPDLHGDPADRFIVASAEYLGATLVTRDERLRGYARIRTVW